MAVYKAPLKDIQFVLNEVLDVSQLAKLPGYEDATPDTIHAIIEEAAKLCENVLFPLNRTGDEEGCTYENGVVRTPKGFKHAYDMFREGGWTAVTCDPEWGGQGLPATVGFALQEMFTASNQAFAMYPGLSHGAYEALSRHGSDELKKRYLPKLADGTWSGTMCLTEPHCGTDLGMLRTKAEPQADGSYAITGTKIFITAGEHDLTDNIVHLVLARLPDAPAGVKGISLPDDYKERVARFFGIDRGGFKADEPGKGVKHPDRPGVGREDLSRCKGSQRQARGPAFAQNHRIKQKHDGEFQKHQNHQHLGRQVHLTVAQHGDHNDGAIRPIVPRQINAELAKRARCRCSTTGAKPCWSCYRPARCWPVFRSPSGRWKAIGSPSTCRR